MATAQDQQQTETGPPAHHAADAEAYESTHVHAVYEAIAPHFSLTRHSPWPRVAAYLAAQHAGAIGLDVGCGNGKYLDVNPTLHMLGSDRSNELVRLARSRGSAPEDASATQNSNNTAGKAEEKAPGGFVASGTEVAVADGLALPYRLGAFDFVICIAVVHHLSTKERRVEAIGELLSRLQPSSHTSPPAGALFSEPAGSCTPAGDGADTLGGGGGGHHKATGLVYVWALEQSSSRRGWDEGSEQDTLVPWVMRAKGRPNETFQRYYHLYRQGELEEDIAAAGGVVEESGYERDNWWAVFSRPQS